MTIVYVQRCAQSMNEYTMRSGAHNEYTLCAAVRMAQCCVNKHALIANMHIMLELCAAVRIMHELCATVCIMCKTENTYTKNTVFGSL